MRPSKPTYLDILNLFRVLKIIAGIKKISKNVVKDLSEFEISIRFRFNVL